MKIGLALGGGAARGLAHLGIIKVLKEEDIKIDVVVGTSMGAIIGALYVTHNSMSDIMEKVKTFLTGPLFHKIRLDFFKQQISDQKGGFLKGISAALKKGVVYTASMSRQSYVRNDLYMDVMSSVLPDVQIQDMRVPFAAVATDLVSGEEVVLKSGPLRPAIAASSAIPGLMPPITIDGKMLVDGGWIDQVPVRPTYKMGADFVMAVDVGEELDRVPDLERSLDIVTRANFVARKRLMRLLSEEADLLIRPDMKEIHWADFSQLENAIQKGEQAARGKIEALKELIGRTKVKKFFQTFNPWKD